MGGDGQALGNKRRLLDKQTSYLKASDDPETDGAEKNESSKTDKATKWQTCAISLEPLEIPICFDTSGHVFSKQSVIDYLIRQKSSARDDDEQQPFSIRRLSDVCDIANADEKAEICCPISGFLASSGQHSFVGLWGCGHVVAASVMEAHSDSDGQACATRCPVCDAESFVVRLNISSEDAAAQKESLRDALRKARKRKHSDD